MPTDAQVPARADAADLERKRSEVAISGKGFGGMLMPQSLQEMVTFAEVMAKAEIALPKHLRGQPGACLAVCMQALRWEMDPFAVANKSYSVSDRLSYEAQLVNAVVLTRAPITSRPRYEYSGEGDKRKCKVWMTLEGEDEPFEYETPEIGKIPVKNSPLWKGDPDQQLGYYAIRAWARRHTPEVLLGVYTREEMEADEPRNVTPGGGSGLASRLKGSTTGEGFSANNGDFIDAEVEVVKDPVSFADAAAGAEDVIEQVAEEADAKDEAALDDPDNPEWTEADFAKAKPAREVLGDEVVDGLKGSTAEEQNDPQTPASPAASEEETQVGDQSQAPSDTSQSSLGEATTTAPDGGVTSASPSNGPFDDPDILTWAAALYRAVKAEKVEYTVDQFREIWDARKADLKRKSPDLFRQVNAAIADFAVKAGAKAAGG